MYFRGSRYEKVPTARLRDPAGRTIQYSTTRFIVDPPAFVGHQVVAGERLDLLSWHYFRDAERFWLICDANRALWPDDLLDPGSILRIPPSGG